MFEAAVEVFPVRDGAGSLGDAGGDQQGRSAAKVLAGQGSRLERARPGDDAALGGASNGLAHRGQLGNVGHSVGENLVDDLLAALGLAKQDREDRIKIRGQSGVVAEHHVH